jgi:hypothetical protein
MYVKRHVFLNIISPTARFMENKKILKIKRVLIFSTNLSKTFLTLRKIQRDIITNVHRSIYRVHVCLFVTSGPGAKAPGCTAAI